MTKSIDPRRKWRRLHEWPAAYRVAWEAATAPGDDLDQPNYGRSLQPASLATISRNFGRFISFLDGGGELDDQVPLAEYVTPARIAGYLRELQTMTYAPQSITLALSAISCTMRILAPERDWHWIWAPNGISLAPYLKGRRKELAVPHPSNLYSWGLKLMETAQTKTRARDRLAQYRDGLIICMLAGRAPRKRSFAAMRLGEHLFKNGQDWRLKFEPADVKNRRWIETSLPQSLTPWLDRYVNEILPALLERRCKRRNVLPHQGDSQSVWLSTDGSALTADSLTGVLWNRSGRKFATPFATHRFRHAIGTHAPADDPEHPGLATGLLAISGAMHQKHYNRAQNHIAETRYNEALREERAKSLALARRLLAERRGKTSE